MKIRLSEKGLIFSLVLVLVTFAAAAYQRNVIEDVEHFPIPLEKLPISLGEWHGHNTPGGLADDVRDILQLDKFVKRIYTNNVGEEIVLYVGYWNKQSGEHQAAKHSPSICLPANGWNTSRQPKDYITFDKNSFEPLHVKRLIGTIRDRQALFTYWFFTGEHLYNEEWSALTRISLEAAIYGRSDGGIVEISAPISLDSKTSVSEALKKAKDRSDNFIRLLFPELNSIIRSKKPTP